MRLRVGWLAAALAIAGTTGALRVTLAETAKAPVSSTLHIARDDAALAADAADCPSTATPDTSAAQSAPSCSGNHRASAPPIGRAIEWDSLPRTTRDPIPWLRHRPECADATSLLRSAAFNPRDVTLSQQACDRVATIVAASAATAAAAVAVHEQAREREFAAARSHGRAVRIDLRTFEGRWALSQLGPAPFCSEADGATWGVRLVHMPETVRTRAIVAVLGAELVTGLAGVFADAGALTAEERLALTARAGTAATTDPAAAR